MRALPAGPEACKGCGSVGVAHPVIDRARVSRQGFAENGKRPRNARMNGLP
jgi:hypothetical protein